MIVPPVRRAFGIQSHNRDESSIRTAENALGGPFPPDYRLFLGRLHTLDRPMRAARFLDDRLTLCDRPSFINWRDPQARLQEAEAWLVDGLAFSVEQDGLWPDSWGPRPDDAAEREHRLRELVKAAPRLIPVFGHPFMTPTPPHRILSIVGGDAIVYAGDLRGFLVKELAGLLPHVPDFPDALTLPVALPFWDEIIS